MAARVAVAVALLLLLLLAQAAAHNPCCARVTPYHIQALAQRMAQRFQALEFRAQDLRGVFAAFQAVHGNATNRLRHLEAEHAHLSETVSRLDSRVQTLEAERSADELRARLHYKRTPVQRLPDAQGGLPFMTGWRRRRREGDVLPHLLVHLDQTKGSSEDLDLTGSTAETVTAAAPSAEASSAGLSPTPTHDAPARAQAESATTPTPLWQLEETASALLDVMSAGDDDGVGAANVADAGTSYWAPANASASDSLEKLFGDDRQRDEPQPPKDSGNPTTTTTTTSTTTETAVSDTINATSASNSSVLFLPDLSANGSEARVSNCRSQNGSAGEGCEEGELSDVELQAALGELEALLQRPPPSAAPPPDPEKALLKRALRLALGALDRTSDACLKLVNFTADAFEGLAAAEA